MLMLLDFNPKTISFASEFIAILLMQPSQENMCLRVYGGDFPRLHYSTMKQHEMSIEYHFVV